MEDLKRLWDNNRTWAANIKKSDPDFFKKLSQQQNPEYLWIGCSDSRVPANQIMGLLPGEVFVHRNVANLVVHSDLNCLSVVQYAVEVLKVKHIIVCGHYGCGGVNAVLTNQKFGLIDNWLRHLQDHWLKLNKAFMSLPEANRLNALCELNVIEQARNICTTTIVQDAWKRGQKLAVHGFIYGLNDGLLTDLGMSINAPGTLDPVYEASLEKIFKNNA